MKILCGKKTIGDGFPVFIIAEAGVNHNGDLSMALDLVDVAAEGGADAVKFQTFRTEDIITQKAPKARYHVQTTGSDSVQTWYELLKTQELSREAHERLIERCERRNITFLSTPYDFGSVDLLDQLNVPMLKVASTDANNHPLLAHMASKKRPIILSTAMCTLSEVKASVECIRAAGQNELIVTHCTGSYPAPANESNLRAMHELGRECAVIFGYSDHVDCDEIGLAAVAMGACVYERHFTLSRELPGPDHRSSLEPHKLASLIKRIRLVETALGDGHKQVMPCEQENRGKLRKSLLAGRDIQVGERLNLTNLAIKRAGGKGLPPDQYEQEVAGKKARTAIAAETPIILNFLE